MVELTACPDRGELERFQRGEAAGLDPEAVAAHLEHCPRCAQALATLESGDAVRAQAAQAPEELSRTDAVLSPVRSQAPSMPSPKSSTSPAVEIEEGFPFLQPPQKAGEIGRLGRYRVLRKLGEGGL